MLFFVSLACDKIDSFKNMSIHEFWVICSIVAWTKSSSAGIPGGFMCLSLCIVYSSDSRAAGGLGEGGSSLGKITLTL